VEVGLTEEEKGVEHNVLENVFRRLRRRKRGMEQRIVSRMSCFLLGRHHIVLSRKEGIMSEELGWDEEAYS